MKYSELPEQERAFLEEARTYLMGRISHNAWGFIAYNKLGTRFFSATRRCIGWQDTNSGNSMPFGGGNYWEVKYGEVTFIRDVHRTPVGGRQFDAFRWCEGRTFGKITTNTKEITIPKQLANKKDVLDFYNILVMEGQRDFLPLKMVNIEERPSYSSGTFYYGLDNEDPKKDMEKAKRVDELYNGFIEHTKTAEQHEFVELAAKQAVIEGAYKDLQKNWDNEHADIFIKWVEKFLG